MLKCKICNSEFDKSFHLSIHIKQKHNIPIKDYYDKYYKTEDEGFCKTCRKTTKFQCMTNGYITYCCNRCAAMDKDLQKIKKSKMKVHYRNGSIQKKTKETCNERYGVDNPSQSKKIKNKKKQTFRQNYGVDNCFQHPKIQEKSKETCLEKYGVEYSGSSPIVQKKKKQTCLKKYGVEHYSETDEYKEKIKHTCNERYGVDNVFELDEIKKKSKESCLKKYGTEFASQSIIVKDKSKETCMLKFGVDNHAKTYIARLKSRNMLIERIKKENGNKINPMRGSGEKPCFDELEKHIPFKIDRDFTKIGYFPDGFIHELNLVIEFDEPEHQSREWYKEHDMRRNSDFEKIGYETHRIKKINWDDDPNKCIKKFKNIITKLDGE